MELMDQVAQELSAMGYDVNTHVIAKNNQTLPAMTVRIGEGNAAPLIYPYVLEEMQARQPGISVAELADGVIHYTREHMSHIPDVSLMSDRDFILENVRLAACRADWNSGLLEDLPYRMVEGTDIAVYPKIHLNSTSTVRPTKALLDSADITDGELLEAARANSCLEYKVDTLMNMVPEIFPPDLGQDCIPSGNSMVIISNSSGSDGASAICEPDVLEKARQLLGAEEIYVIPSSIHELIAVRSDNLDRDEVTSMIVDINGSIVDEHDRLSDHPYTYDGRALSMEKTGSRENVQEKPVGRSR